MNGHKVIKIAPHEHFVLRWAEKAFIIHKYMTMYLIENISSESSIYNKDCKVKWSINYRSIYIVR